MDLDPFEPVGINAQTMRLLDIFLLHCLLADSPPDTPAEIAALARNQHRTAEHGRRPGLMLERGGQEVALADWGRELLDECAPIAAALDRAEGGRAHHEALMMARQRLAAPESTPSARVLAEMSQDFDGSHIGFVAAHAQRTRARLLALPYDELLDARFRRMAEQSVADQRKVEAADRLPFEEFRQQYLAVEQLGATAIAA
jgi:glutamate--cysteine ligase